MYSIHNEGKCVIAETLLELFIRTLKTKPVDFKDNRYIDSMELHLAELHSTELHSNKDPKFKVDDHARILNYKNIFAKAYTPNWSEEVFVIKKVKNTVPWTYVINDLNGDEVIGTFYEKNYKRLINKNLG